MKAYTVKSKSEKITFNVEEYNSSMELVAVDSKREVMENWKSDCIKNKSKFDKDWYGVDSYDEALSLLRNGWTENLDKMRTLTDKIKTNGNGKRIAFKNNVSGFAPIVPLAIMNVPNSMIDTRIKPIKSKVVKIMYNITVNCGTSTKTILESGMKVIKAVINLENSGYRCEIYAMQTYYDYNTKPCDTLLLKLKEANQPLDLKRVMFPLIHPAMFRVIGFDWQDKLPNGTYMCCRGHAIGYKFGDRTANIIKEAFGDNCYYLDATLIKDKEDDYIERLLKGEEKDD